MCLITLKGALALNHGLRQCKQQGPVTLLSIRGKGEGLKVWRSVGGDWVEKPKVVVDTLSSLHDWLSWRLASGLVVPGESYILIQVGESSHGLVPK